jgi:hypothetical protein
MGPEWIRLVMTVAAAPATLGAEVLPMSMHFSEIEPDRKESDRSARMRVPAERTLYPEVIVIAAIVLASFANALRLLVH